ncbi:hypothetical protein P4S54_15040 [Shewanella sp. PP-He15 brown]
MNAAVNSVYSLDKKTKLSLLVLIFGFLVTIVQTCFWVDAGKTKENKAYEYKFQLDVWNNEIHKNFNLIKESGVVPKLLLSQDGIKLNDKTLKNINEYHYLLKELLRALNFNSSVAIYLLNDISQMTGKVLINIEEPHKLVEEIKNFSLLIESFKKREERLNSYYPELISAFNYNKELNDKEKDELFKKQVSLLQELYSSDELFLKHNTDPFAFVKDLGESANAMLNNYELVITTYNEQVTFEDNLKKSIIYFLTLFSFYLSALILLQPESKSICKRT